MLPNRHVKTWGRNSFWWTSPESYMSITCMTATVSNSSSGSKLQVEVLLKEAEHRTLQLFYLHPLPALWWGPLISQLRQGSGHPLVHGRTGGLTGKHGACHLQLLHPRLRQPLVAPDRDEGVCLGRGPRHPSASREAVGGGWGRRPARGPWAHVQRREAVRRRGIGVVLVTVTQILGLRGWHLGFRYL